MRLGAQMSPTIKWETQIKETVIFIMNLNHFSLIFNRTRFQIRNNLLTNYLKRKLI
jgi:hypothetical protein